MFDFKAIQNLGYSREISGFPDDIKRRIDTGVTNLLTKIWRGTLQVAASGFGKGVLITAALVIAGFMISGGAGAFTSGAIVDAGVKEGFGAALHFLTGSVGGLITLLAGGAIGSVSDTQKYQDRMTADMAKAEAARLELVRSRALEKQAGVQPSLPAIEHGHTNGRGALSVANAMASGQLHIPANGHVAREEERRARQDILGKAF